MGYNIIMNRFKSAVRPRDIYQSHPFTRPRDIAGVGREEMPKVGHEQRA